MRRDDKETCRKIHIANVKGIIWIKGIQEKTRNKQRFTHKAEKKKKEIDKIKQDTDQPTTPTK